MNEIERVHEQLKRAFQGPAWSGPSVLEVLAGVTAAQAARRPIAGAHTIWEIALHIGTWEDVVRRRALGQKVEVSDDENWPTITEPTAKAWEAAIARITAGHMELRRVVAAFDPRRIDEPLVPGGNTAYVQFHGAAQHDLYHAGQIAVLRKE
jgi:hypothetical protein